MADHWVCSGDGSFKLSLSPSLWPRESSSQALSILAWHFYWKGWLIVWDNWLLSTVLKHMWPNTLNLIEINAVPEQLGQHTPEERPSTQIMAKLNWALYVYTPELNLRCFPLRQVSWDQPWVSFPYLLSRSKTIIWGFFFKVSIVTEARPGS